MSLVVDASSTLALIFEERGSDVVLTAIRGSILSAVNLDEVLHKSARRGIPFGSVEAQLARLEVTIAPFDTDQARYAAELYPALHPLGISFADRACLALAKLSDRSILTADRDWSKLDLGIEIRQIR